MPVECRAGPVLPIVQRQRGFDYTNFTITASRALWDNRDWNILTENVTGTILGRHETSRNWVVKWSIYHQTEGEDPAVFVQESQLKTAAVAKMVSAEAPSAQKSGSDSQKATSDQRTSNIDGGADRDEFHDEEDQEKDDIEFEDLESLLEEGAEEGASQSTEQEGENDRYGSISWTNGPGPKGEPYVYLVVCPLPQ